MKSLRYKLVVIFLLVILFILVGLFSCSYVFMQNYYVYKEKTEFENLYRSAYDVVNNKTNENIMAQLSDISSNSNTSMIVSDYAFSEIYASTNILSGEQSATAIKNMLIHYSRVLEIPENKDFATSVLEDQNGIKRLILKGKLNDRYFVFFTKPLGSMIRSIEIYQEFFLIFSVIIAIIGGVLTYFLSYRITKPIYDMIDISKRITNLDFSKKYISNSENELNTLGISLNTMSDKLSENIAKLYKANNTLKNDLNQRERNETMRKEFLQNASHELKTPIAVISSYSEMLKDKIITEEEDCEYYYNVIYDETEKMSNIVKALLSLAQLESQDAILNIESFNISELVEEVIVSIGMILEKNDVKLKLNIQQNVYVSADRMLIERVISNYILNAVYHSEGSNIVEISLNTCDEGTFFGVKNKTSKVLDNKKIWYSFYKDDTSQGNGLGLSIVKAVMESHNKKYGVNNLDGYVQFYIIL